MASDTYRKPAPGVHPAPDFSAYRATALRHPHQPLIVIPQTLSELTGPAYPYGDPGPMDADLTRQHAGAALGEHIVVEGQVMDEDGRPIRKTLVEIWQANAAGRYAHKADTHEAPLDPNFSGAGRTLTDAEGRYRFETIKPGPYPWANHANAWRPAHIHFSLFGACFLTRLVTQMYFPGDPLQPLDPILNSIADPASRRRLIAAADTATTFRWDIVLRGRQATPMESS